MLQEGNHVCQKKKIDVQTNRAKKEKEQEFRYDYLLNLLEKQVQYQHLNAEKGNCLIAIDVAFIGAVIAITQFVTMPLPATVVMLVSLLSVMIGFIVCIIHIQPRMNARIGNEKNPRSMAYIVSESKERYYSNFKKMSIEELIRCTSYQLSGMSRLNARGYRLINVGTMFTLCGVVLFAISIVLSILI